MPLAEAPVLNTMSPLLLAVALATAVCSVTLPLDDAELLPDVTNTSPPVLAAVVLPADNVRLPP